MTTDRLGVTALGVCLLAAAVLAGVNVAVEYHDLHSMLTASSVFAVVVLVPGMLGWGLLKRHELARVAAVVLFASLGLLVAVLGVIYAGFSVRIYRALLLAAVFWLFAVYLRLDVVRNQLAHKDIQRISLS